MGVVCPGLQVDGALEAEGVPGVLLAAFLTANGIVVARTMDHQVRPAALHVVDCLNPNPRRSSCRRLLESKPPPLFMSSIA